MSSLVEDDNLREIDSGKYVRFVDSKSAVLGSQNSKGLTSVAYLKLISRYEKRKPDQGT
jgi:hypothetical protein